MLLCEIQKTLGRGILKNTKSAQAVEQLICDFILKKSSKMKKFLKID